MTTEAVVQQETKAIARPLHVLVPLIKKDLDQGKEASQRAGVPYYKAAGEKMLEAKSQLKHGEFGPWIKRNFGIGHDHARKYMQLAKTDENGFVKPFSSLSDFVRKTSSPTYNKPHTVRPRAWHAGVKESVERARREAERIKEENLKTGTGAGGRQTTASSSHAAWPFPHLEQPRQKSAKRNRTKSERLENPSALGF